LIFTVKKPSETEPINDTRPLSNGDTAELIREAVKELSVEGVKNPSHVYAKILLKAVEHHFTLDELHLGDVLIALRNAGYAVDRKTGLLIPPLMKSNAA
jgi:hypothetical protein